MFLFLTTTTALALVATHVTAIGNLTVGANDTQIHYNAGTFEPQDASQKEFDCPGFKVSYTNVTHQPLWVYQASGNEAFNISMDFAGSAVTPVFIGGQDGSAVNIVVDDAAPVRFSTFVNGTPPADTFNDTFHLPRCVSPDPWPATNLSFHIPADSTHHIVITSVAGNATNSTEQAQNCTLKLAGITCVFSISGTR
ncbi:hypothetical protein EXIGLDRAFT_719865 [Exidia glandulosa HHB12029]|uniref:Uncharacterized protein n=1 Tax=Exidia glandulosa HHB12029 TaxID=1314781 RepID=A0A166ADU5_EXIGL|nr:hypothetical protein EXIGLDRAFT_719865 [Exidia glandulosa HHB12029]